MLQNPPQVPQDVQLLLDGLNAHADVRAKNIRGDSIENFEIFLPRIPPGNVPRVFNPNDGVWVKAKLLLASKNSTVAFIKKSTRSLWSTVLKDAFRAFEQDFFGPLLLIPKLCLCSPPRGGNGRSEGYTAGRLKKYLAGDIEDLLRTFHRGMFKQGQENDMGEGIPQYMEEIVNDLVNANNTSKATKVLASQGVAPYGVETFEELKSKHPQGDEIITPIDLPPPIRVEVKAVRDSIASFAPRSAPGPSGLRAEHLKHAIEGDSTKELIGHITSFVNRFLSASVPQFIALFCLCSFDPFAEKARGD